MVHRVGAAGVIVAAGLGLGSFAWFAASRLLPLPYADRPLEYVFLGSPPLMPVLVAVAAAIALALVHARLVAAPGEHRWAPASLDYIRPLILLGAAPLGAAIVLAHADERLAPFTYVLVDLRWWWASALAGLALVRFDRRRGSPWRNALRRWWSSRSPSRRLVLLDAALFALLAVAAIASSRYLRFTPVLHGDEPKYLRLAENFYQGLGLDVGHQLPLDDLTLTYSPPLWRNAALFAQAVREDAGFLADDARRLMTEGLSFRFNRGRFVEGWFVVGRNGGFYQVHNPGLSVMLFPAYFIDRHFLSSSAGYQGVFPTSLPVTNLLFLLIWCSWGVVVFRFLRAALARDGLAWLLAATAMLTLPVAAFPFQIYPETTGGLIVTAVCLWMLYGAADDRGTGQAVLAGAAVGALPWLHVRFLVLSVVFVGCALFMLRRRRMPFVAGCAVLIAGLCLYSYHLTGSPMPDAMYEAEGGSSPWRVSESLASMRAYPFDRIWGFLPHAPVFLLAVPGWVLVARVQRRTAVLVALLIAALVIPSSGHGFAAAGATPLRHLVAVVPLAMVPLGWTLIALGRRRWVCASFVVLLVLSLDASISYNLHHRKEVGRMVAAVTSGWRPNLLFPWTHAEPWAHWPGTFVLFLLWVIFVATLLALPFVARPPDRAPRRRLTLPAMLLAVLVFMAAATAATALGGEWTRADYLPSLDEARTAAIRYGLGLDRCRVCYSSLRGELGRSNVVADAGHLFAFAALRDDVRVDEEALFAGKATAKDGPSYGTLAIDFGDDETARVEVLGRAEVLHRYRTPGIYRANIVFTPHDGEVQYGKAEVVVRPAAVALPEVDALPDSVKRAPARGAVSRVTLGPAGLRASLADGSSAASVWAIFWDGTRWHAASGSELESLIPGVWAYVVAADPAGWRTEPVMLRWPIPAVTMGAPVVLY